MKSKYSRIHLAAALIAIIALALVSVIFTSCAKESPKMTSGTDVTTTLAGTSEGPSVTTSEAPVTTNTVITTTEDEGPIAHPVFETVGPKVDYYQNPISSEPEVNCGDPFAMRYDGKYYLYCSTGNNSPIYVRVSTDLVNWSERIVCTSTDEIPAGTNEHGGVCKVALPAYAPEVTYYNGKFYMVTSLGGTGHVTFVADSPLGPFKLATDNWGLAIDGDIFIDNDGTWYFYSANGAGIMCYPMASPTEVIKSKGSVTGSIVADGAGTWSEGSNIVYHDGVYFMTYCGNHVSSDSYRIDYSYSTRTPTKFNGVKTNPLLISTHRYCGTCGLGHSSTVKGPDLDSYYIVYHAMGLKGRTLNIDRLFFNGTTLSAMGPTAEDSQICFMPDIYSFFEDEKDAEKFSGTFVIEDGLMKTAAGETVISKDSLRDEDYTIELTTSGLSGKGKAGLVFGYKDDKNYGLALFDTEKEQLVITFVVDGKKTESVHDLVKSFDMAYDFSAVQAIQVEKKGTEFTFFVNDRELCKKESSLSGNKVGMTSDKIGGSFSYIGAVDEVGGSSNKEHYKPASKKSGLFLASHCLEKNITLGSVKKTDEKFVITKAGTSLNYRLDAQKDGIYDFSVYYSSVNGAELELYIGGELIGALTLGKTEEDEFMTAIFRNIPMKKGQNILTVYVKSGKADLLKMDVSLAEEVIEFTSGFAKIREENLTYHDGENWAVEDGVLKANGAGKRTYGDMNWGDYSISVDVTPTGSLINFGILLRADDLGVSTLINSDRTTSAKEAESAACIDWMRGYNIECSATTLSLYKCSYSSARRFETKFRFEPGKTYNIKAECVGPTIRVYVNGELVMEYTDSEAIMQGMPGLRVAKGSVEFDNLEIKKIEEN